MKTLRLLLRFSLLTVVTATGSDRLWAEDKARPLHEAVAAFNDRARERAKGSPEHVLTDEAVIAGIRWALLEPEKLGISDGTRAKLEQVATDRVLAPELNLELLTSYEPNDRVVFDVWSVRLRVPGGPHPGGSTAIKIEERMLGSRLMGPEERMIIAKWAEKENAKGGVGSMERPRWMQEFHRARTAAAEADRRAPH